VMRDQKEHLAGAIARIRMAKDDDMHLRLV
jgi:hypothetical protein